MRRAYPEKQITVAQSRSQMMALLYSCRPANLAALTVDGLCRLYRVDARMAEYELQIARQKRAGEVA